MRSNQVVPFRTEAPAELIDWMWLMGEFSDPPNIRCSNRCANPVDPLGSSLEPTLYQTDTATTGALRSSWTSTVRPLSSWKRFHGISTRATSSDTGAPRSGVADGAVTAGAAAGAAV
ncbi:hypothetical protein D3C86_1581290 [compost metagenome]